MYQFICPQSMQVHCVVLHLLLGVHRSREGKVSTILCVHIIAKQNTRDLIDRPSCMMCELYMYYISHAQ